MLKKICMTVLSFLICATTVIATDFTQTAYDSEPKSDANAFCVCVNLNNNENVSRDLIFISLRAKITGKIGGALRGIGDNIVIENSVSNGVSVIALNEVNLLQNCKIYGDTYIIAKKVKINGEIIGNLKVICDTLEITGSVSGSIEHTGGNESDYSGENYEFNNIYAGRLDKSYENFILLIIWIAFVYLIGLLAFFKAPALFFYIRKKTDNKSKKIFINLLIVFAKILLLGVGALAAVLLSWFFMPASVVMLLTSAFVFAVIAFCMLSPICMAVLVGRKICGEDINSFVCFTMGFLIVSAVLLCVECLFLFEKIAVVAMIVRLAVWAVLAVYGFYKIEYALYNIFNCKK